MFIAALLVIASYRSADQWLDKLVRLCRGYYLAIQRNKQLIHTSA